MNSFEDISSDIFCGTILFQHYSQVHTHTHTYTQNNMLLICYSVLTTYWSLFLALERPLKLSNVTSLNILFVYGKTIYS